MDKAGKGYWNNTWSSSTIPPPVDPRAAGVDNSVNRRFDAYFRKAFSGLDLGGSRLLEIGCARSSWLPYFAKEFGFEVWGLDYSEIGCQLGKEILVHAGVNGEVICADMFSPPDRMIGYFDVVVSFGLVEHFEDTAHCVQAMTLFLKPGGLMITSIPNLVGLIGSIQRLINRPVFDVHVALPREALKTAHVSSGLEVLQCDYFLSTNFGVNNLTGLPPETVATYLKKALLVMLTRVSMAVWLYERKFGALGVNRITSPYINCLARKPSRAL